LYRYIQSRQILPTTPFSLVLRKEYFDCPQRDTLTFKRGEARGVCTLVLCSLATVMSCIDPSVRIVTKSTKVGPLLIFWVYSNSPALQDANKKLIFKIRFSFFLKVLLPHFSKIKSQKESQNSRNQVFSYNFCKMIEGSGSRAGSVSGSIPLTGGSRSGSGRPKNMWIRIRIRIRKTVSGYILTPPTFAQDRANLIYEQKMAAEKRGEVDLAAKLERDFKVGFSRISHFAQQTFFMSFELKFYNFVETFCI
jgi:hypothetical protein